jgi:hypothetical protein
MFGIFRPVLLLPDKILDCLTAREMESIVADDLCHVRRRDNLANVIHTAVEVVFRFHPLAWWLAGVYCEWCDSRNAETAKSLLLKVVPCGSSLQICITP